MVSQQIKNVNTAQTALFRDRLSCIGATHGADGSSWTLNAKLSSYGMKISEGDDRPYLGFDFAFFAVRKDFKVTIPVMPYIYDQGKYQLRPTGRLNSKQSKAIRLAAPGLLSALADASTHSLTYLELRDDYRYLTAKKAANLAKPYLHRNEHITQANSDKRFWILLLWTRLRKQILSYPDKQVGLLALSILNDTSRLGHESYPPPIAGKYISAARLALGL